MFMPAFHSQLAKIDIKTMIKMLCQRNISISCRQLRPTHRFDAIIPGVNGYDGNKGNDEKIHNIEFYHAHILKISVRLSPVV